MQRKTATRLARSLWAVAVIVSAGATVFFLLSLRVPTEVYGYRALAALISVSFASVGAVVASRRPEHPLGWLFVVTAVLIAVQSFAQEYGVYGAIGPRAPLPGGTIALWLVNWMWVVWVFPIGTFGLLLFPDGRLPSRRWRPVLWLSGIAIAVETLALALKPGPLEAFPTRPNPVGVSALRGPLLVVENVAIVVVMLCLVLSVASAIVRRRRADPDTRRRLRWFLVGGAMIVAALFLNLAEGLLPAKVPGLAVFIAVGLFPVVLGMGILRHGLFDIEVVVNKAVVYAALAAFITVDYVAIVVGVGALVGRQGNAVLTAVAAALAAISFQPLRRRLARFANRLVYGQRATPYEVLSEFSERVGGEYAVEDVLPRMARALGEGTGAARSEVRLRVGEELRSAAVWPEDAPPETEEPDRLIPVTHQGEDLGALAVWKARGEAVTAVEEKLVEDLAAQAGLVLRNVRLNEELRASIEALRESRQRLVTAQDAERRRLERDIHDGAQQHLVSLMVKIRVLETLARRNPERVGETLADLKQQAGDALDTLRELARGIYPPLLADQGLAAALEAHARRVSVPVTVNPDGVGRYPQEVEAAVYFCSLEALQNVAKYAEASRVDLTLRQIDGVLAFEVRDDGRGFDVATTPPGSGLVNMRDRLEALGGTLEVTSEPGRGTVVRGRIATGGGR